MIPWNRFIALEPPRRKLKVSKSGQVKAEKYLNFTAMVNFGQIVTEKIPIKAVSLLQISSSFLSIFYVKPQISLC
jgi:hypothetical protein